MFDPHLLWLYVGAAALLILTPGPDTFLVAATSAADGPRAGVLAIDGRLCRLSASHPAGCRRHLGADRRDALGLVPSRSRAVYLVWIGLQGLRAAWRGHGADRAAVVRAPRSDRALFLRGALTNALNPKAAVFFIAFLPQFVDPRAATSSPSS